jgi:rhodanese-related sulfurtransferase
MTEALDTSSPRHPAGFREVEPRTALVHLGSVRIVDVREPHEFTGDLGHIRGAELVPLNSVGGAASRWARDEALLLVCRSGGRSGRAAAALAQAGFTKVYNLNGGMLAWNDAGLPVER